MNTKKTWRVAVLPGDGIGPEVIAQATRAIDALAAGDPELSIDYEIFEWPSHAWHEKHGESAPADYLARLEKFDAMAAAELLVMPSYYESLSMVTLEAWALGRPVIANGGCDVLAGQCVRSNAGLFYENYEEFAEALHTILAHNTLRQALGENGRTYFNTHYTWPVIEQKYLGMLERLEREGGSFVNHLNPLPGWLGRHRRDLPPGQEVVARLPTGPAPLAPSTEVGTR